MESVRSELNELYFLVYFIGISQVLTMILCIKNIIEVRRTLDDHLEMIKAADDKIDARVDALDLLVGCKFMKQDHYYLPILEKITKCLNIDDDKKEIHAASVESDQY